MKNNKDNTLWRDRKRSVFGLPFSFTRYRLYDEKLIIDTGFFNRLEDEIRLYRIMDISLKRSFRERIWGLGTIHCCSGDKTCPEFNISHIKKPKAVKNMLSDMIEEERLKRRVGVRENIDADDDEFDDDEDCDSMH